MGESQWDNQNQRGSPLQLPGSRPTFTSRHALKTKHASLSMLDEKNKWREGEEEDKKGVNKTPTKNYIHSFNTLRLICNKWQRVGEDLVNSFPSMDVLSGYIVMMGGK